MPPGPMRDFVEALHALYDLAGQPATRQISRATYRSQGLEAVSHETVSSVLRGRSLPSWNKVRAIVTVLTAMSVRPNDATMVIGDFHRLWLAARKSGGGAGQAAAVAESPPPSAPAPVSVRPRQRATFIAANLPDLHHQFVGRELLLDRIDDIVRRETRAPLVLVGPIGTGKSQLALTYAHRHLDDYSLVWWIDASSVESARVSLVDLANRLPSPRHPSTRQAIAAAVGRLESMRARYLLIFDGAEGDAARTLIPGFGGDVIVTTRDPQWANDNTNIRLEVPEFDRGEAIQFLRKRDPELSGATAADLVVEFGGLPLGLAQLVVLRHGYGESWRALTARLAEPVTTPVFAGAIRPPGYPDNLAAAVRQALDRLADTDPDASRIAELFTGFGPAAVSVPMLRAGAAGPADPDLRRILADRIGLPRSIAVLARHGLGRLHGEQRIDMSPVVRLVLRELLGAEGSERARREVDAIVTAAGRRPPDDLGTAPLDQAIAPHVDTVRLIGSADPAALQTARHHLRYHYLIGNYERARDLARTALATWTAAETPAARTMAPLAAAELASALRALGRYDEAARASAAAMAEPASENDENTIAAVSRSRAADLRIAGLYQEACELDERALAGGIELAAADHATDLRLLGDFAAAEAVNRAGLSAGRIRGTAGRGFLLAFNGLVESLFGLGRYREILDLSAAELGTAMSALRPGDRGILIARRTVAAAHRRLGDPAAAIALLRPHWDECTAELGGAHVLALAARNSYANALRDAGRLDLAREQATEVVLGYESVLGDDNPLTHAARVNLAAVLRSMGERRNARHTVERAWDRLRAQLGDGHPFTVAAAAGLASDLALTGDREGALAMSRRVDAIASGGPDGYLALVCAANLALDRSGWGEPEQELSIDEALGRLRRVLGPAHPVIAEFAGGARLALDLEPPTP